MMMMMKNLIQYLLLTIVLVSTIGAQKVIYAQVGEKVTLTSVNPLPDYGYWYYERPEGNPLAWLNHLGGRGFIQEDKWKNKLFLSGTSLVIDFQEGLFGTFVCLMTKNGKTETVRYTVIQIKVDVKPDSLVLSEDPLSLTCNLKNAPQGRYKPSIYWLSPKGQKVGNQGVANVSITNEHNGQWSCVVKDNNQEKKIHVSVAVVGFAPVNKHQYASTNSSLTIPCAINSGITWEQILKKELQEVQWDFVPKLSSDANRKQLFHFDLEKKTFTVVEKHTGLRPESHQIKDNLSLTTSKAKVENRGRYTCSMKFKNGKTLNSTVDVDVLQITAHPRTELIYGQQVNLSCSTGDHLPDGVKLNWSHPDTSSPHVSHHTHITIPEVGKGDSGKWSCELWKGGHKLTSADILLKTEPRLSVWMLVIICGAAVILLLLLVLVFIHCRRRQQKMRVLRHRLCQCKHPKPKGFYRT